MEFLTTEAILAANDIPFETVDVPEWGGSVRVKGLSGTERDAYEDGLTVQRREGTKFIQETNIANARAKFCALVIVDASGVPQFRPDQVVALGKKSGMALQRVFQVGMRLSGMTQEEIEKLGNASGSDPNAASASG